MENSKENKIKVKYLSDAFPTKEEIELTEDLHNFLM